MPELIFWHVTKVVLEAAPHDNGHGGGCSSTLVVTEKNGNEFEITLHGETIESLQIKELE